MNIINNTNLDIIYHVAIIQDRDNNNSDLEKTQNFFRDTTSITARAHPFTNWTSGALYDQRMSMNPINSDKYNVITHKQFILSPKTRVDGSMLRPYFKRTKNYYPIKRRIAFDNATDEFNWRPFYICQWWQPVNPTDYVPTTGILGVTHCYKSEVVFKNLL